MSFDRLSTPGLVTGTSVSQDLLSWPSSYQPLSTVQCTINICPANTVKISDLINAVLLMHGNLSLYLEIFNWPHFKRCEIKGQAVWRPVSTLHRGHTGDTLATAGTPEQRSSRAPAPRAHTALTVYIQQILLSVSPRQDVFILKSEDFPTRIESPLPYPKSIDPKKFFF